VFWGSTGNELNHGHIIQVWPVARLSESSNMTYGCHENKNYASWCNRWQRIIYIFHYACSVTFWQEMFNRRCVLNELIIQPKDVTLMNTTIKMTHGTIYNPDIYLRGDLFVSSSLSVWFSLSRSLFFSLKTMFSWWVQET